MTAQRISARQLLRSTFDVVGSLYLPLLIINSPYLIYNSLNVFFSNRNNSYWHLIYLLCAFPLLSGATIFYTYQSLTGNQVTVGEAFKHAYRRLPQLMFAWIPIALMFYIYVSQGVLPPFMFASSFLTKNLFLLVSPGLIALIIPGLYLWFRLQFSLFATALDNAAAQDSISSSWKLTNERWWLLFRANLLIGIVTDVPLQLISLLISNLINYLLFYSGFWVIDHLVHLVAILLQISFILLLNSMAVLTSVYLVLLYRRLRDSAATIQ